MFEAEDNVPYPARPDLTGKAAEACRALKVGQSVLLVGLNCGLAYGAIRRGLGYGNYRSHLEGLPGDKDRWIRVWRTK